jgi:hypothetical protein
MNKLTIPDGLAKEVADKLGCKTDAAVEFLVITLQNVLLFDRKQNDYGPGNMAAFGSFGVIVRANDKFERLKHIFNNRRGKATNESITDSFRDISNYCIIAEMLESGKWPNYVPTIGTKTTKRTIIKAKNQIQSVPKTDIRFEKTGDNQPF